MGVLDLEKVISLTGFKSHVLHNLNTLETSGQTTKRTRNNAHSHLTTPFSSPPAMTLTDIPSGWLEKATEQMISLQWTWPIRSPFTVHRRRSLPPPTEINMSELLLTGWAKTLASHCILLHAVLNRSERVRREDRSVFTWVADCCDVASGLAGRHSCYRTFVSHEALNVTQPAENVQRRSRQLHSTERGFFFFLYHIPVEVPEDTGAIFAHADEDAVGFAHKQAGDLCCVSIQVDLRLHLHLWWLGVFRQNTCDGDVCWRTFAPLIPFVCWLEMCFKGNCEVTNDAESFSTIRAGLGYWCGGRRLQGDIAMVTHRGVREAVAVGGDDSTFAARKKLTAVRHPGTAGHLGGRATVRHWTSRNPAAVWLILLVWLMFTWWSCEHWMKLMGGSLCLLFSLSMLSE